VGRTTPNCPFSLGDLDPHLICGSLGPPESALQTASRSVHPFLHSSLMCPTQTDRPCMLRVTSVAIGRIVAVHATQPNHNNNYHYYCSTGLLLLLWSYPSLGRVPPKQLLDWSMLKMILSIKNNEHDRVGFKCSHSLAKQASRI